MTDSLIPSTDQQIYVNNTLQTTTEIYSESKLVERLRFDSQHGHKQKQPELLTKKDKKKVILNETA